MRLLILILLVPSFAYAQTCEPSGPLILDQLAQLGINAASVSSIVLRAFAVVVGFWAMGYSFGLLTKAISRA